MKINQKIQLRSPKRLIWLSMILFFLILSSCSKKSTALNSELQRKERIERAAKSISDAEAAAECFDMLNNAEARVVKLERSLFYSRDSTRRANRKVIIRAIEGSVVGLTIGYIIGKF